MSLHLPSFLTPGRNILKWKENLSEGIFFKLFYCRIRKKFLAAFFELTIKRELMKGKYVCYSYLVGKY